MNFHKIILGSILVFSTINLFAQDDFNQTSLDVQSQENIEWIYNNSSFKSSSLFEEDLLIARRTDDVENDAFIFQDSFLYEYNVDGHLKEFLSLTWDGQAWNNSSLLTLENNSFGSTTYLLSQGWVNGEWVNLNQFIFQYDDENNGIFRSIKRWDNNEWLDVVHTNDTYNQDKQLLESRQQSFSTGEWVNSRRDLYTYNSEGNPSALDLELWINEEWVPSTKNIYQYDENGNLTEDEKRRWDMDTFVPELKNNFEYDDQQNELINKVQYPIDGQYEDAFIRESIYNDKNLLQRQTNASWQISAWVFTNSNDRSYDDRENLSYVISQNWSTVSSEWEDSGQAFYYYQIVSPVKNIVAAQLDFTISPNPSNGLFELNFGQSLSEEIKINIYSLEGKIIDQLEVDLSSEKTSLNLTHLTNGTYFLSATSATGTGSQKIFIER